jgi:DNA-binding transcriptional regulator of glucitol operon
MSDTGFWSTTSLVLIFGGLVTMWVVQMFFTWKQAQRFMGDIKNLRRDGTVAIGVGGRRYRGGRAFVALAHKDGGTVVRALTLTGYTVVSKPKELPALAGMTLDALASGEAPMSLKPKIREAAVMAAKTLTSGAQAALTPEDSRQEGTQS